MMKRIFCLTVLLGLASPAWGQSYGNFNDGGYSESAASQMQEQNNYNQMQSQAMDMYQQQQMQAQQEQMQRQLNQQQDEINSFNNAAPIQRMYGNY